MSLLKGRKTDAGYEPSWLYKKLRPDTSGNDINGLGESQRRRPRHIFWTRPKRIVYGKLQKLLVRRFQLFPYFWRVGFSNLRKLSQLDKPAQVNTVRREKTSAEWTGLLKSKARALGADLVGVVRLDPNWVFEGMTVQTPTVVMLGFSMDYQHLSTAPQVRAAVEVMDVYNRGLDIARKLRDWVAGQGFEAVGHCGPEAGPVAVIPAALACGFGELGKHGSIINREFGSSWLCIDRYATGRRCTG